MHGSEKNKITPNAYSSRWALLVLVSSISIALNFVFHRHVRQALSDRYPNDSFYTLDNTSAIGLAIITSTLLLFVLSLFWFFNRIWVERVLDRSIWYKAICLVLNLCIVVGVYTLMLVVAPQIFYSYYQWVFTDLPVQWVIKPIANDQLLYLVSLPSGASMADHLAGFVLWVLLSNTLIQWILGMRDRDQQSFS